MNQERNVLKRAHSVIENRVRWATNVIDSALYRLMIENLQLQVLPIGLHGISDNKTLSHVVDMSDWLRMARLGKERDYAKQILKTISSMDNCKSIWNVGAAQGLYTLLAHSTSPHAQVYAFEPDLDCSNRLERNVQLNNFDNIHICRFALGDEDSQLLLNTDGCSGKAPSFHKHPKHKNVAMVEVKKGDALVNYGEYKSPDLMIIDVEGFEGPVLSGLEETMKSHPPRHIFLEMHPDDWMPEKYTSEKIVTDLIGFGYEKSHVFIRDSQELFHFSRSER